MEKRLSAYEKASDIQVATDHKTPEAVAVEIMKKCENHENRKNILFFVITVIKYKS